MSADVNIKIIKDVYDAFGRGDVAAVLDAIADVHAVVRIRATSRATGKSLAMNTISSRSATARSPTTAVPRTRRRPRRRCGP